MTQDARRKYDREYYASHREHRQAQARAYRLAHPGRHAAQQRRWREAWPDRDTASRERQDVKRIVKRIVLQRVESVLSSSCETLGRRTVFSS